MSSHAALSVVGNPKIAILVTQLIFCQKIRTPIMEDFPVEKIRMHVCLTVNNVIALNFRLDLGSFQREFLRTGRSRASVNRVEYISGEAAFVASTFDGEFCARQPDFFRF